MGQQEIKIRSIPRSNEKPQAKPQAAPASSPATEKSSRRFIIYVGTCGILFAICAFLFMPTHQKMAVDKALGVTEQTDLSSVNTRVNQSITRHLQDTEIQHDMMVRTRELENEQFRNAVNEPNQNDITTLPDNKGYGVQFDTENAEDRIFEDINGEPVAFSDTLPADRINARLAKRKWVNEQERAERIEFVGNFIRSAYDRGYEVELDQNLVVVGVHKFNPSKKVNINQVIDRLARQGL